MREELKERLARSFAAPGAAIAPPDPAAGSGSADAQFRAAFLRKAERVVYPAMLEIGRVLERHGRFFSIELLSERTTCHGVLLPTSVQMNLFRRSRTTNFKNGCPHFNVVCDAVERRVVFQYTVPSAPADQVTACGRCTLEQLGRDLVQEKLVATFDAILHA